MIDQRNREKIPLTKCRSILKQTGIGLSDEQIIEIRNYLFELAQIDYDIFIAKENKEQSKIVNLENEESVTKEKQSEKPEQAELTDQNINHKKAA